MSVVDTVAPAMPAGIVVDVKRDGHLAARMEQLGTAWALQVMVPEWTTWCADVVEAYKHYVKVCDDAGIAAEGDDALSLIEVKQRFTQRPPDNDGARPGTRLLAQIVAQKDNTWALNVFHPEQWNRNYPTVLAAFHEVENYCVAPNPERGPVGGR